MSAQREGKLPPTTAADLRDIGIRSSFLGSVQYGTERRRMPRAAKNKLGSVSSASRVAAFFEPAGNDISENVIRMDGSQHARQCIQLVSMTRNDIPSTSTRGVVM